MQKDVKELEENLKSYIGSYPNTYTYTKSLAEKQLVKTKGHVNVVIWRPSIIGSGIQDPFPGWTDTLSAAGGLALLTALGLMQLIHVKNNGDTSFDLVPVDYVSNGCIAATAYSAMKNSDLEIYNMATSVKNMITFENFREIGLNQYKT